MRYSINLFFEKGKRMGALDVKTKIYSTIDAMPLEKLDAVLAFLEDLQRSSEDETVMLMREPGFMRDYQEAKKDIRTGTTVSLKAIRR